MKPVVCDDGVARCWWGAEPEIYRIYHDAEWGRPATDDHQLFEKVCLEGFQSGLSWLTILRKRDNFRAAFSEFDPRRVAAFDEGDIRRLMMDEGIVRNEAKIRSTVNNAERALELIEEQGSLKDYFWRWAEPVLTVPTEIPAMTDTSTGLSTELKRRGWSYVGPTTIYAFMQAMGLVNDHLEGCDAREGCAAERRSLLSAS